MDKRPRKLPVVILGVVVGMGSAFFSDLIIAPLFGLPTVFGFSASSLGWLIPLAICGYSLVAYGLSRIRFPYLIWFPWLFWVLTYLLVTDQSNALQRSIMLFTPLVVGMAVSTLRENEFVLGQATQWLNRFFWIFMIAVGMTTGLLTSGTLAASTGFAAGSITAALLAIWYASRYATYNSQRDLYRWILLAVVPVLANTRTGMVAVAITLPLTFAPLPLFKRLIFIGGLALAGVMVFQMDRVQTKMFYGGEGTLQDAIDGVTGLLSGDADMDKNFATSGRLAMALELRSGLAGNYWFGNGANASEEVTKTFGGLTHPHNDWLRLQYDYGALGAGIFALTLIGMTMHALLLARRLPPDKALYLYVGAGAFVPMAIFMFTDNVILYAAWFGNLHFALLGLGYAAARDLPRASPRPLARWR